jgi:sugar phosphate isomerase/epimerase
MTNRYSLAHLSAIALPPVALIEAAHVAGYDYVGLRLNRVTEAEPLYPLISSRSAMAAAKSCMADTGVRVWDVELVRMDPHTQAEDYRPLLDATAELGALHVIAQLPDPDRARAHDRLAHLCDLAAPLGITVNLEFPWWTETGNLQTAAAALQAVQRPNAALLVDALHFHRSGSSLVELAKLPPSWFHYAHLCDGHAATPADQAATLFEARCARLMPGAGAFGVEKIISALPANVVCALEIPNDALAAEIGFHAYVRRCLQATRRLLDQPTPVSQPSELLETHA